MKLLNRIWRDIKQGEVNLKVSIRKQGSLTSEFTENRLDKLQKEASKLWVINYFPHIEVAPLDTKWQPRVQVGRLSPNVHSDLITQFPRLGEILSTIHHPWNNLYWETWPPVMDVMKWGWTRFDLWSQKAQKQFDQIWPDNGDEWIDSLIDIYGSSWHIALPILAIRDQPEFLSNLQSTIEVGKIVAPGIYTGDLDEALKYAPWVRTVRRRSWTFPSPKTCSICGIGYYVDTVRYYLVRKWGHSGICPRCMFLASFGIPETEPIHREFSLDEALKYLQILASLTEVIPPQSFRETFSNPGFESSIQNSILAAMICIPNANLIRDAAGGVLWLKVLQLAGLVGDAWRPARGTYCFASDGHPCRSLAERSIDDWLTEQKINHQVEPLWPQDSILNPTGRLRADWELYDGTFVEYAGLNSKDYLLKIEKKRKLASKTGLKLIVLFPEDLLRLGVIFQPWIKK